MTDLNKLAASLRTEFEANPQIAAAGLFGSVSEHDTWAHSDIDLFVITPEENDRWEGVYLRRGGVKIHLQTLSSTVLRKNSAANRGNPFFTALAGVTIWFDRSGDLVKAVATARAFTAPGTRLRACREFCPGIESLHLAEKFAVKGKFADSRAALTIALGKLAAAAHAESAVYPPRDIWASPITADLPEATEFRQVWTAADGELKNLIDGIWRRVRPEMARVASPIIDVIRRDGSVSYQNLEAAQDLRGIDIPERLLDELVASGHLVEVERPHEGLGLQETCYAVPLS